MLLSLFCMSGSKSRYFKGRDPERIEETGLWQTETRLRGTKDIYLLRYGNVTGGKLKDDVSVNST